MSEFRCSGCGNHLNKKEHCLCLGHPNKEKITQAEFEKIWGKGK